MANNPTVLVQFVADTAKLAAGVKDIQKQGDTASKGFDWKRVTKFAGAAVAVGAAAGAIKGAVTATEDLAKSTMALSRTTGLDTKTASEWTEVLKTRGIEVSQFQVGIVKLSKLMEKSRATQAKAAQAARDYADASDRLTPIIQRGGDAGKAAVKELNKWGDAAKKAQTAADNAAAPFTQLGVSMADVRKGNTQGVIMQVADGLSALKNPATQAAATANLFGKAGLKLAPILYKGSDAIQEQLDTAEKYGATVGDKTAKQVAQMAADQREMTMAMDGAKVQLGTAMIPVLTALSKLLTQVLRVMQPLLTNATALKVAIGLLVTAFVAYKVAVIAQTIAQLGLNAAMLPQIALVLAIAAAIAALIVVGYELYKHWDDLAALAGTVWDAIQSGADAVLSWLRANWPLVVGILTGPFGLAVAEIIHHWDTIRDTVTAVGRWVKEGVLQGVSGIGNAVWSVVDNIWGSLQNQARTIQGWGDAVGTWIKDAIVGGLAGIGNAVWGVVNNIWAALQNQAATIVGWGAAVGGWIKGAIVDGLTGVGNAAWSVVNNIWAAIQNQADTIVGWGKSVGSWLKDGIVGAFHGVASAITSTLKGALNAVLVAWNGLRIPGFKINMPSPIPDVSWPGIALPNLPLLAQGGIVTRPTVAMIGEAGPEAVLPLGANGAPVEVRVYIGDQELRGMVRSEVRTADNRTAQVLLAGAR